MASELVAFNRFLAVTAYAAQFCPYCRANQHPNWRRTLACYMAVEVDEAMERIGLALSEQFFTEPASGDDLDRIGVNFGVVRNVSVEPVEDYNPQRDLYEEKDDDLRQRMQQYMDPNNDTAAQPDHAIWCESLLIVPNSPYEVECNCGFEKWKAKNAAS